MNTVMNIAAARPNNSADPVSQSLNGSVMKAKGAYRYLGVAEIRDNPQAVKRFSPEVWTHQNFSEQISGIS
jgi:hypothetical protein